MPAPAGFRLRDAVPADLEAIHALNEAALPAVNSLTPADIERFAQRAEYFRVAEAEAGDVVAFLIGLFAGHAYESPNYRWFSRRHERFAYVDRIVVAEEARGRGLGAALYDDFARFSAPHAPVLTCEVNLRPRNEPSLRFHERLGFRRVGTQLTDGGRKQVVLLEKPLGGER